MGEKIKTKKSKEEIIEILTAILLGVTALAMAWATWIGALHGGNQATNYTKSNNLSAEGNSMYNEAAQAYSHDMLIWNEISQARIDYEYAEKKGDKDGMEKAEMLEEQLIADNCSEEFKAAIAWADEHADEDVTPFDMEGFKDSYFEESNEMIEKSDAVLKQGQADNAHGDAYGLVSVIYSLVLFLLGIVSIFKHIPNRVFLLIVAAVGLVLATIYMLTIPLPTDFNIFNYFGK